MVKIAARRKEGNIVVHTSAALSVISKVASSGGTSSTSGSSSSSSSSRVSEGEGYDTSWVLCEGGRWAMAARVDAVDANVRWVFPREYLCEGAKRAIGTDVDGFKRDTGLVEVE